MLCIAPPTILTHRPSSILRPPHLHELRAPGCSLYHASTLGGHYCRWLSVECCPHAPLPHAPSMFHAQISVSRMAQLVPVSALGRAGAWQ